MSSSIRTDKIEKFQTSPSEIHIGDVWMVNFPSAEKRHISSNGDSVRSMIHPGIVIDIDNNKERPFKLVEMTHGDESKASYTIKNTNIVVAPDIVGQIKAHHFRHKMVHIPPESDEFKEIISRMKELEKEDKVIFVTQEQNQLYMFGPDIEIKSIDEAKNEYLNENDKADDNAIKYIHMMEIFNSLSKEEKEYLGGTLVDSPATVFRKVAYKDKKPIGFVELYDGNKLGHGNECIIECAVIKEARRCGLGKTLVKLGIDWFKKSNFSRMIYLCKTKNIPSQKLAAKMKFNKKKIERDHIIYEMINPNKQSYSMNEDTAVNEFFGFGSKAVNKKEHLEERKESLKGAETILRKHLNKIKYKPENGEIDKIFYNSMTKKYLSDIKSIDGYVMCFNVGEARTEESENGYNIMVSKYLSCCIPEFNIYQLNKLKGDYQLYFGNVGMTNKKTNKTMSYIYVYVRDKTDVSNVEESETLDTVADFIQESVKKLEFKERKFVMNEYKSICEDMSIPFSEIREPKIKEEVYPYYDRVLKEANRIREEKYGSVNEESQIDESDEIIEEMRRVSKLSQEEQRVWLENMNKNFNGEIKPAEPDPAADIMCRFFEICEELGVEYH